METCCDCKWFFVRGPGGVCALDATSVDPDLPECSGYAELETPKKCDDAQATLNSVKSIYS